MYADLPQAGAYAAVLLLERIRIPFRLRRRAMPKMFLRFFTLWSTEQIMPDHWGKAVMTSPNVSSSLFFPIRVLTREWRFGEKCSHGIQIRLFSHCNMFRSFSPLYLHKRSFLYSFWKVRIRCELLTLSMDNSHHDWEPLIKKHLLFQNEQSFQVGKPLIYSWLSPAKSNFDDSERNIIANVFFEGQYCLFHQRYIEPQVLSTHTNLGNGDAKTCQKTKSESFIRFDGFLRVRRFRPTLTQWNC